MLPIETARFVGGMPINSPVCLPAILIRTTTRSPSANISSSVWVRSGKAAKNCAQTGLIVSIVSVLSLALRGSPIIQHAGSQVAFPTRKTLALLAYLAVERGAHSREKIAALLWPESNAGQARTTLRSTLALLRTALGEPAAHL